MKLPRFSLTSVLTSIACFTAFTQLVTGREAVVETIKGNIFKPAKLEATPERIASLKLPDGFKIEAFATDLEAP